MLGGRVGSEMVGYLRGDDNGEVFLENRVGVLWNE